jgi:F0F1-type ATP synthase membrane subunit a
LLSSPKVIAIAALLLGLAVASVLGGALGAAFGVGFLGGAVPHLQVPSELVTYIGDFALYNTVVMFLAAIAVLGLLTWLATRKISDVPGRWQSLMEILYEFFIGLAESTSGKAGRIFIPVATAIFLVVLFSNWLGVLPVVGNIGRVETTQEFFFHKFEKKLEENQAKELLDSLHHDVGKNGEGMGDYLKAHADDESVQKLVGKTLETYGEQDFVVFDGDGIRLLPLGRGNQYKLSLIDVVAYDVADPKHPTAGDVSNIAQRVDHSIAPPNAPDSLPKTEFFSENPDKYASLSGKRAGILVPYLRGPSTDLNMTLAIALFAMASVQFWGIKTLGIGGYWDKFVGNPFKRNPIDLFVGLLELVGEFIKVISFTFRLFGNMFAGEILLIAMGFLFPLIGMIPFIGLELFVGFIQAIIFSVLTLMFGAFAIMPHHHPESDHHGAEGH